MTVINVTKLSQGKHMYKKVKNMDCRDVDFFKENRKNKNTTKATSNWMRNLKRWALDNQLEQDIEKLDAEL